MSLRDAQFFQSSGASSHLDDRVERLEKALEGLSIQVGNCRLIEDEHEMRREAMQYAVQAHSGRAARDVVQAAAVYHAFLLGRVMEDA